MGTHAQALGHTRPTATTVLAGVLCGDRYYPLAGPYCLACEDATEPRPAGIADALSQVVIPQHIGDLQIFQVNRVVLAQQGQRGLVVVIGALAFDVLMGLRQQCHGLLAAGSSPLSPPPPPSRLCAALFSPSVVGASFPPCPTPPRPQTPPTHPQSP